MSKVPSTAYHHKFLLKIGLTVIAGLMGQTALAACPDTAGINIESQVIGTTAGGTAGNETIFFCKQNFPSEALLFRPQEEELLSGGSRAISKGSTIQTDPLLSSVDLSGFNINDLAFKTLSANFPNTNGLNGPSSSLFNFYTKRSSGNDCSLQYPKIRDFLRVNPGTFETDPKAGVATTDSSSNSSIAKISGAKLTSSIDPTKNLLADIFLYHANFGQSGQFFTDGSNRYCWFGVGTRVTIKTDNLDYAGDYTLKIGVNIKK